MVGIKKKKFLKKIKTPSSVHIVDTLTLSLWPRALWLELSEAHLTVSLCLVTRGGT